MGTWSEAELTSESLQEGGQDYVGKFRVQDLLPRTVYLARVASLNQYGYNDFGEVFKFATKGAGNFFISFFLILMLRSVLNGTKA